MNRLCRGMLVIAYFITAFNFSAQAQSTCYNYPMFVGFESYNLPWQLSSGVTRTYESSINGSYSLKMEVGPTVPAQTETASFCIDLLDAPTELSLEFGFLAEATISTNSAPVEFSVEFSDGLSSYIVPVQYWTERGQYEIDIDRVLSEGGLGKTANFQVKFILHKPLDDGLYSSRVYLDNVEIIASQPTVFAQLPLSQDFEQFNATGSWKVWNGYYYDGYVRTEARMSNSFNPPISAAHSGDYQFIMDLDPAHNTTNVIPKLSAIQCNANLENLASSNALQFEFWLKHFSDNCDALDGVYFSDDGGLTFTKVYSLQTCSWNNDEWQLVDLDVDALALAHGLSLNTTFSIEIRRYGTGHIPVSGGFAIDDIRLFNDVPPIQQYAELPYQTDFNSNELDEYWKLASQRGSIALVADTEPEPSVPMDNFLQFVSEVPDTSTANNAILHLNLKDASTGSVYEKIYLSFDFRDDGDQSDAGDGIYLYDDEKYVQIFRFNPGDYQNQWHHYHQLDLIALIENAGIDLEDLYFSDYAKLCFSHQTSNTQVGQGSIGIDNVLITTTQNIVAAASYPISFNLSDGSLDPSISTFMALDTMHLNVGEVSTTKHSSGAYALHVKTSSLNQELSSTGFEVLLPSAREVLFRDQLVFNFSSDLSSENKVSFALSDHQNNTVNIDWAEVETLTSGQLSISPLTNYQLNLSQHFLENGGHLKSNGPIKLKIEVPASQATTNMSSLPNDFYLKDMSFEGQDPSNGTPPIQYTSVDCQTLGGQDSLLNGVYPTCLFFGVDTIRFDAYAASIDVENVTIVDGTVLKLGNANTPVRFNLTGNLRLGFEWSDGLLTSGKVLGNIPEIKAKNLTLTQGLFNGSHLESTAAVTDIDLAQNANLGVGCSIRSDSTIFSAQIVVLDDWSSVHADKGRIQFNVLSMGEHSRVDANGGSDLANQVNDSLGHGGSHGGMGGEVYRFEDAYDDISSPSLAGEAGQYNRDDLRTTPGKGGGILQLDVPHMFIDHFAKISAEGMPNQALLGKGAGGGAGGTVKIFNNEFIQGTGFISTDGGVSHRLTSGGNGTGGGGGRIAIYTKDLSPDISMSSFGGRALRSGTLQIANKHGGAGTVFVELENTNVRKLMVANKGIHLESGNPQQWNASKSSGYTAIDFMGTSIELDTVIFSDYARIYLQPADGEFTELPQAAKIDSVFLQTNAHIDADGLGYAAGPGAGGSEHYFCNNNWKLIHGASHAGLGGNWNSYCKGTWGEVDGLQTHYGDYPYPKTPGSGELGTTIDPYSRTGRGGGVILLKATHLHMDTLTEIHANGIENPNSFVGASGGSVWLELKEFSNGSSITNPPIISADGAHAKRSSNLDIKGGGGSGGYCAVKVDWDFEENVVITALGGYARSSGTNLDGDPTSRGGAGKVYLRYPSSKVLSITNLNKGYMQDVVPYNRGTLSPLDIIGRKIKLDHLNIEHASVHLLADTSTCIGDQQTQILNAFLDTNSIIDANGMGYRFMEGPGAPSKPQGGGNYVGIGSGNASNVTYGHPFTPKWYGSGGADQTAHGGGVISMKVDHTFIVDGTIQARGGISRTKIGSGAGGSISIIADSLKRNHSGREITARAGLADVSSNGGSGGRIYLDANFIDPDIIQNTNITSVSGGAWGSQIITGQDNFDDPDITFTLHNYQDAAITATRDFTVYGIRPGDDGTGRLHLDSIGTTTSQVNELTLPVSWIWNDRYHRLIIEEVRTETTTDLLKYFVDFYPDEQDCSRGILEPNPQMEDAQTYSIFEITESLPLYIGANLSVTSMSPKHMALVFGPDCEGQNCNWKIYRKQEGETDFTEIAQTKKPHYIDDVEPEVQYTYQVKRSENGVVYKTASHAAQIRSKALPELPFKSELYSLPPSIMAGVTQDTITIGEQTFGIHYNLFNVHRNGANYVILHTFDGTDGTFHFEVVRKSYDLETTRVYDVSKAPGTQQLMIGFSDGFYEYDLVNGGLEQIDLGIPDSRAVELLYDAEYGVEWIVVESPSNPNGNDFIYLYDPHQRTMITSRQLPFAGHVGFLSLGASSINDQSRRLMAASNLSDTTSELHSFLINHTTGDISMLTTYDTLLVKGGIRDLETYVSDPTPWGEPTTTILLDNDCNVVRIQELPMGQVEYDTWQLEGCEKVDGITTYRAEGDNEATVCVEARGDCAISTSPISTEDFEINMIAPALSWSESLTLASGAGEAGSGAAAISGSVVVSAPFLGLLGFFVAAPILIHKYAAHPMEPYFEESELIKKLKEQEKLRSVLKGIEWKKYLAEESMKLDPKMAPFWNGPANEWPLIDIYPERFDLPCIDLTNDENLFSFEDYVLANLQNEPPFEYDELVNREYDKISTSRFALLLTEEGLVMAVTKPLNFQLLGFLDTNEEFEDYLEERYDAGCFGLVQTGIISHFPEALSTYERFRITTRNYAMPGFEDPLALGRVVTKSEYTAVVDATVLLGYFAGLDPLYTNGIIMQGVPYDATHANTVVPNYPEPYPEYEVIDKTGIPRRAMKSNYEFLSDAENGIEYYNDPNKRRELIAELDNDNRFRWAFGPQAGELVEFRDDEGRLDVSMLTVDFDGRFHFLGEEQKHSQALGGAALWHAGQIVLVNGDVCYLDDVSEQYPVLSNTNSFQSLLNGPLASIQFEEIEVLNMAEPAHFTQPVVMPTSCPACDVSVDYATVYNFDEFYDLVTTGQEPFNQYSPSMNYIDAVFAPFCGYTDRFGREYFIVGAAVTYDDLLNGSHFDFLEDIASSFNFSYCRNNVLSAGIISYSPQYQQFYNLPLGSVHNFLVTDANVPDYRNAEHEFGRIFTFTEILEPLFYFGYENIFEEYEGNFILPYSGTQEDLPYLRNHPMPSPAYFNVSDEEYSILPQEYWYEDAINDDSYIIDPIQRSWQEVEVIDDKFYWKNGPLAGQTVEFRDQDGTIIPGNFIEERGEKVLMASSQYENGTVIPLSVLSAGMAIRLGGQAVLVDGALCLIRTDNSQYSGFDEDKLEAFLQKHFPSMGEANIEFTSEGLSNDVYARFIGRSDLECPTCENNEREYLTYQELMRNHTQYPKTIDNDGNEAVRSMFIVIRNRKSRQYELYFEDPSVDDFVDLEDMFDPFCYYTNPMEFFLGWFSIGSNVVPDKLHAMTTHNFSDVARDLFYAEYVSPAEASLIKQILRDQGVSAMEIGQIFFPEYDEFATGQEYYVSNSPNVVREKKISDYDMYLGSNKFGISYWEDPLNQFITYTEELNLEASLIGGFLYDVSSTEKFDVGDEGIYVVTPDHLIIANRVPHSVNYPAYNLRSGGRAHLAGKIITDEQAEVCILTQGDKYYDTIPIHTRANFINYVSKLNDLGCSFTEVNSLKHEDVHYYVYASDPSEVCSNYIEAFEEQYGINVTSKSASDQPNDEQELSPHGRISIHPNPTDGVVTVEFGTVQFDEEISIEVHDALGQKMVEKSVNITKEKPTMEIDLTAFPKGMYTVKIIQSSGVITEKVVKE